jgi:hypothetical protein
VDVRIPRTDGSFHGWLEIPSELLQLLDCRNPIGGLMQSRFTGVQQRAAELLQVPWPAAFRLQLEPLDVTGARFVSHRPGRDADRAADIPSYVEPPHADRSRSRSSLVAGVILESVRLHRRVSSRAPALGVSAIAADPEARADDEEGDEEGNDGDDEVKEKSLAAEVAVPQVGQDVIPSPPYVNAHVPIIGHAAQSRPSGQAPKSR